MNKLNQISMFDNMDTSANEPLAEKLRPRTLEEFVGQKHLLGKGKVLYNLIRNDQVTSMIFWGPPGVGKTTLAKIIANTTQSRFITFSAVTSGIKEIRLVMQEAEQSRKLGERTIVFIDEIHRFNKAQQDAFLPFVEKGSIVLIGATTENPSFEVNGALLSRCKVFVLKTLEKQELVGLLRRAIHDPRGFGDKDVQITDEMLGAVAVFSGGDARSALSTLEMLILNGDYYTGEDGRQQITVSPDTFEQCTSQKMLLYDKDGEEHYNLISALHKSMRNSDTDAALYWLARMLEAGEDPLYIARRVTRFAAEDVGLADPRAMEIAIAAYQACHFIGMPECSVHLTEAVVYMALAPKSNAMETAYFAARDDARQHLQEPVPLHIRNAPTQLMKEMDYGKGYKYAHDFEEKVTAMKCMPDDLEGRQYYNPSEQGLESRFKERYEKIKKWKEQHR